MRVASTSPIFKVLRDAGVPMDPENGQTRDDANTWVIHFPMKSPDGAITRKDRGAIEQCNYWLHNKLNWTDHNPSVTVTYKPDEIMDLTKWIWEHRDLIGGMAFLPSFDAHYAQLPYIEITAKTTSARRGLPGYRLQQTLALREHRSDDRRAGAGLSGGSVRNR